MLTRVYIDNFRCFVNFEIKLGPRQLLFGENGAGKSSFMDALLFVRQLVVRGDPLESYGLLGQHTRWMQRERQTFELDAVLEGGKYAYRLELEPWGERRAPRIVSETVHFDGKPVFEFLVGEVHLYNDNFQHKVTYEFDWHRSALATIQSRKDNRTLSRFKQWLASLLTFRINPFAMTARAESEDLYPNVDLSNLAAWYRHLVQAYRKEDSALIASLRASLPGFEFLEFQPVGENVSLLRAEFENNVKFYLNELSDGQRCLISLYALLHFVVSRGGTVLLDEPDNFIALREIQPWLMNLSDTLESGHGQVLMISHHPEILNQWAPGCGLLFTREEGGPTRAREFSPPPDTCLPTAEWIARGWERE